MEKMILFQGYKGNEFDIEKQVNKWLSDNPKVEIVDRKVTMTSGNLVVYAVTIFYRENEK